MRLVGCRLWTTVCAIALVVVVSAVRSTTGGLAGTTTATTATTTSLIASTITAGPTTAGMAIVSGFNGLIERRHSVEIVGARQSTVHLGILFIIIIDCCPCIRQ